MKKKGDHNRKIRPTVSSPVAPERTIPTPEEIAQFQREVETEILVRRLNQNKSSYCPGRAL